MGGPSIQAGPFVSVPLAPVMLLSTAVIPVPSSSHQQPTTFSKSLRVLTAQLSPYCRSCRSMIRSAEVPVSVMWRSLMMSSSSTTTEPLGGMKTVIVLKAAAV